MINEDPSKILNHVYTRIRHDLPPIPGHVYQPGSGVLRKSGLPPRLALGALCWMVLYSLYQLSH
ncbi:hypothetical protein FT643_14190 [Ketobacter sp. MCCC 1A13808]|uniref:hypothetical protein n=1 Tax=Ketobacter sp. MCCC 1A13808 TaxID=2602738 RepID=UPI0012EB842D|nr:hypothetical protein [Ketobacter sp. MCCC 1A13808]MVF13288.1 hypothetical protein [Ketobacter sp. MCCC 1A13808]